MTRPVAIWVVIALVGSFGAYCFRAVAETWSWPVAVLGALALTGSFGLVLRRRWSRYVVYSLAFLLISYWSYELWHVVLRGWPYPDLLSSLISLIPGAALILVCLGCCLVTFRYFRALRSAPKR